MGDIAREFVAGTQGILYHSVPTWMVEFSQFSFRELVNILGPTILEPGNIGKMSLDLLVHGGWEKKQHIPQRGVILLPTQTMPYCKGNPSKFTIHLHC